MVSGRSAKTAPAGARAKSDAGTLDVEVRGAPAFSSVTVSLRPGQSVLARAACMVYLRGDVRLTESRARGGILDGFKRLLAGDTFFVSTYAAPAGGAGGVVSLAPLLPGDAVEIALPPGAPLLYNRGAFLCSTTDVETKGSLNLQGILPFGQDEGAVLPVARATGSQPARVWIAAYGAFEKHVLAAGESMLVNNGMFLASIGDGGGAKKRYTLDAAADGVFDMLTSGEGLAMKFTGPGTVWTQSRNLQDLVDTVASELNVKHGGGRGRATPKPKTGKKKV